MALCATNALSFELDDATGGEPIRSAILGTTPLTPRATISGVPLTSGGLRKEAMISGPFDTPTAAIPSAMKAMTISASFRHWPGDNFAAGLFFCVAEGRTERGPK